MEKSKSCPGKYYNTSSTSENSNGFFGDGLAGFQPSIRSKSYNFNGPSRKDNLEAKRKKRIAAYNMLEMEIKLKSTAKNGVKWIKSKFTEIRYGM
ncbi:uncharacterized protein LOC113285513 [Papaver somniferum]|uniref:uncharacterized protein LOC113285513 n=1 Tax=Papaver somniferum TaxID=3469 RepID=UPI000E704614|nr:uncharacterized protein LOC113285513 [Papaver somniferum]